ncbi:MAG: trehalase family glycosidase [Candidatus Coatesbacteria bacterium]
MAPVTFDLSQVPYSRRGSYLCVSRLGNGGLFLRTVRGGLDHRQALSIALVRDGKVVPGEATATPDGITLAGGGVKAELVLSGPARFRFRVEGGGLRLAVPEVKAGWKTVYALPDAAGRWQVNASPLESRYMLVPLRGTLAMDAPWARSAPDRVVADFVPVDGVAEGAVDEWFSTWVPGPEGGVRDARASVAAGFSKWLDGTLPGPPDLADARALTAYVNWSAIVGPSGHFRREAMLMSKNWMTNVWSWDHCFNAMALAAQDPDLAWDQFMVMFDQQDAHGAIPDSLNDRTMAWTWCKPPIHGWTLLELMKQPALAEPKRLREAYGPLVAWTRWWLEHRDADGDGACDYHHGNDSGWDNSTVFDGGCPLEGADLTAFLVIQAKALAEVAGRLELDGEAIEWRRTSDRLMKILLAHHWRADRFISPKSGDHAVADGDSLIGFLPLLLGPSLPAEVRRSLVAGVTEPGRFLTDWGCATESVRSRFYESNGYWRGPIWAPPMMMLCDGLDRSGERATARDLAARFCRTVAKSGAAENFDAKTGEGLCDRAYTWTASVFLLLANRFLLPGRQAV